MVYFIQTHGHELVKIGVAMGGRDALLNRLRGLQTGNPFRLVAIGAMAGGTAEERALHRRFSRLRVRYEWFWYESDLRAFIAGHLFRKPLALREDWHQSGKHKLKFTLRPGERFNPRDQLFR